MKKTYIAPSLKVVFVKVSNFICTSLENGGTISGTSENEVEGDARSFGGLVWEEEEVQ